MTVAEARPPVHLPSRELLRAGLAAPMAGAALMAFYLGTVTWAQGWEHAVDLLKQDVWFVLPITAGFALQVGLFLYMRALHAASSVTAAVAAGSPGMSGSAVLACCAHHLNDVLPVIGVSGAAVFLNEVKTPLAVLGIAMNLTGVGFMLHWLSRL